MAREVEFLGEEDGTFAEILRRLPQVDRPARAAEVESLATEVRRLLGVPAQGPLHDIGKAMARVGVMVFSVNLGADEADAATVLLRQGAVSIVNAGQRTGRRRLSAAHELGHALVADDYTVDHRLGHDADRNESLFDQFARVLLLPDSGVAERWRTLGSSSLHEAAVRMASEHRVDMATLARRLTELDMVDAGQASEIRATRTSREDIVEYGLVVADELMVGFIPDEYRDAVERLYLDELLSADRALDLLRDTRTKGDLPELPLRRENEIWEFVSR